MATINIGSVSSLNRISNVGKTLGGGLTSLGSVKYMGKISTSGKELFASPHLTWPEVQRDYVEDGELPNLNNKLQVTDDMIQSLDTYAVLRNLTAGVTKGYTIIGIGVVVGFWLMRNISMWFGLIGLGVVLFALFAIVMPGKKKIKEHREQNENGKSIEEVFIDNCLTKIIRNYDPYATVVTEQDIFPGYGQVDKNLPGFLYSNNLIPYGNDGLKMNIAFDSLFDNKDGFYLTEAIVTNTTEDKDGHKHTETRFEGQIIAFRIAHKLKAPVKICYSGKGFLKKESLGSYRKIKETIDIENEEFNSIYEVGAEDMSQAFVLLTPAVAESLVKMRSYGNKVCIYAMDDFIIMSLNSDKQVMKIGAFDTVEEQDEHIRKILQMVYKVKATIDKSMGDL